MEQGSTIVQYAKLIDLEDETHVLFCRTFKNVTMLECERTKQMIVAGVFLPIKISRFVNISCRSCRNARILAAVSMLLSCTLVS